jgi:hypothetical protein
MAEMRTQWQENLIAAMQAIFARAKGTDLFLEGVEMPPLNSLEIIYGGIPPEIAAPMALMNAWQALELRLTADRLRRNG